MSADFEFFKAALVEKAVDFDRTITRLESGIAYTVPFADKALLDEAFEAANGVE